MTTADRQSRGQVAPALRADEVHVWEARPGAPSPVVDAGWSVLDRTEQDRADRYRFPVDRDRFVASRAILRTLLGGYVGNAPEGVSFGVAEWGKPICLDDPSLCFSSARSGELFVVAVCRDRQIGVDVEQVRSALDVEALSRSYLTDDERESILEASSLDRPRAMASLLSCKEALLKACGVGLRVPLDHVEIPGGADREKTIRRVESPTGIEMSLVPLELGRGYVGWLAVGLPQVVIRRFTGGGDRRWR